MVDIGRADVNWEAVRAEYVAGDLSQVALAKKRGVSVNALKKRAGAEGWAAAKARGGVKGENAGRPASEEAVGEGPASAGVSAGDAASGEAGRAAHEAGGSEGGEIQVARHTRMALLQMLERAAAAIPCNATEIRTTGDGGEVRLLKLRDLTAAYKELAGDLSVDGADGGSRVVIDI